MSKKFNKRAMELSSRKLVLIILMIIVIALVMMSGISNFVDSVRTGITDVKTASGEYYEKYSVGRGVTGGENFKEEGASQIDFENPSEENQEAISSIDEFAQQYNIEKAKLMAIIDVESNKRAFYSDDHPVVRFECVKFNNEIDEQNRVPCDVSNYPYGSAQDTGRDAFERALETNRDLTLLSSSYGFAQILGSNYKEAGFNSVEKMYEAMFSLDGQRLAFLNFIKNSKGGSILRELQKEDTNWANVAHDYNGPRYEDNNYDEKLIAAYQENLENYS